MANTCRQQMQTPRLARVLKNTSKQAMGFAQRLKSMATPVWSAQQLGSRANRSSLIKGKIRASRDDYGKNLILKPEPGLSSNSIFLSESLSRMICFGTILEKLYHIEVP